MSIRHEKLTNALDFSFRLHLAYKDLKIQLEHVSRTVAKYKTKGQTHQALIKLNPRPLNIRLLFKHFIYGNL